MPAGAPASPSGCGRGADPRATPESGARVCAPAGPRRRSGCAASTMTSSAPRREVGPLATTSANRHGEATPPTAAAVAEVFGTALGLVLDGEAVRRAAVRRGRRHRPGLARPEGGAGDSGRAGRCGRRFSRSELKSRTNCHEEHRIEHAGRQGSAVPWVPTVLTHHGHKGELLTLVDGAPGRLRTLQAALTTWTADSWPRCSGAPTCAGPGRRGRDRPRAGRRHPPLRPGRRPAALTEEDPDAETVATSYVVVAPPDRWRWWPRLLAVSDGRRSWAGPARWSPSATRSGPPSPTPGRSARAHPGPMLRNQLHRARAGRHRGPALLVRDRRAPAPGGSAARGVAGWRSTATWWGSTTGSGSTPPPGSSCATRARSTTSRARRRSPIWCSTMASTAPSSGPAGGGGAPAPRAAARPPGVDGHRSGHGRPRRPRAGARGPSPGRVTARTVRWVIQP